MRIYNERPSINLPVFPGTALRIGSTGSDVLRMQQFLNAIATKYPSITPIQADGFFGVRTAEAVRAFQMLFGLTVDGVIGRNTWDKIAQVYSELDGTTIPTPYPGTVLRVGSRGNDVLLMQQYLNEIAKHYSSIPTITADGIFGTNTSNAVRAFQQQFGLAVDGLIGRNTWNKIVSTYNSLRTRAGQTSMNEVPLYELPLEEDYYVQSGRHKHYCKSRHKSGMAMALLMKMMLKR